MAGYNQSGYYGQTFNTVYPNYNYSGQVPAQTAVPMTQQSPNTLLTVLVGSYDEVLSYPVAAGVTVILIDFNGGTFWVKATSKTGVPETLRVFDFTEKTQTLTQNQNDGYVLKSDFDEMKSKLDSLIEKLGGDK